MRGALIRLVSVLLVAVLCAGGGEAFAKKKKGKKPRAKATQQKVVPSVPASSGAPAQATPSTDERPSTGAQQGTLSAVSQAAGDQAFGKTYKIKVMVMGLAGSGVIDANLLDSLTQVIPETLDRLGPFKAISSVDVRAMLAHEAERQMLGCNDQGCLAELGGALGADFIVTGSLDHTNDIYVLQLQLMNVSAARVDGRASREHSGTARELFDEVRGATKILVRDVLGQRSGDLAVSVSEEGATVKIDGSIVGSSPVPPQTLAGGAHRLEVEKQGFVVYRQDVNVVQDETSKVRVQLLPSEEFKRQYTEDASMVRRLAWVGLAVGAVGLGSGAALFMKGRGDARALNRDIEAFNAADVRETEREAALASREEALARTDVLTLAASGVGVAALVAGIVLMASGDDPDRYEIDTGVSVGGLSIRLIGPLAVGVSGAF